VIVCTKARFSICTEVFRFINPCEHQNLHKIPFIKLTQNQLKIYTYMELTLPIVLLCIMSSAYIISICIILSMWFHVLQYKTLRKYEIRTINAIFLHYIAKIIWNPCIVYWNLFLKSMSLTHFKKKTCNLTVSFKKMHFIIWSNIFGCKEGL